MRVASIDIGSNSIILLIADRAESGQWQRVEEHTEITRLAQGLDARGALQPTPVQRTLDVLRRFVLRAQEVGCTPILLTGTAPFRRAENGIAIARQFEQELGQKLRIVSGEEEGQLTLRATRAAFPGLSAMSVLDIGGASTELLCFGTEAREEQSVDLGVVRLMERFVHHDPPSVDACDVMRAAIREQLRALMRPIGSATPLIGVGGTVTTLAALALDLSQWDPEAVQGFSLSTDAMAHLGKTLWPLSIAQRLDYPGLHPKRADVIGVGAWYVYEICQHLGQSSLIVSDRGIRWGRIHAWEDEHQWPIQP